MTLREVAALGYFLAALTSSLLIARRVTRRPIGMLWPLAFAFLIVYAALLLNLLSLFRSVDAFHLVFGLAPLILLGGVSLTGRTDLSTLSDILSLARRLTARLSRNKPLFLVLPLALIVLVSAVVYPPTTWDSMTYHVGRVAHWVQNRSVAYYPTSIDRQNWMGPGAEYLILLLQVLARSDRWANCVQLLAWLAAAATVPPLCRVAGLPRRLGPWAAVFVTTTPMALFQASSTQNDLVASLLALGLVSVSLSFVHRAGRWRYGDLLSLAATICAAYLVKPTTIIAAAPLLAWGAGVTINAEIRRRNGRRLAGALLAGILLSAVILGPDLYRKLSTPRPDWVALVFYTPFHEVRLRVFRVFAAAAHHSLFPETTFDALRRMASWLALPPVELTAKWQPPNAIPVLGLEVFRLQEDFLGNPFQFLVSLAALVFLALAVWKLPRRLQLFAALPPASWILFHLLVRDNPWLPRLQLPLFMLMPLLWAGVVHPAIPGGAIRRWILQAGTVLCVSYGYVCVTGNIGKPVTPAALMVLDRDSMYYVYDPPARAGHEAALAALRSLNCGRLGLYIGGDSYDYPLTWRAIVRGAEVHHYVGPSDWPCLIFSDRGRPPDTPAGKRWTPTGPEGVFRIE